MTTSAVSVESDVGVAGPNRDSARLSMVRIAVGIITATATFVALLPSALFLGKGAMLWYGAGLIVVITVLAVVQLTPAHLHTPSVLELMASFLSALSLGSMASIASLGCYSAVQFLHWVASKVAGLFNWTIPFGWERPATVVGYFVAAILIPGIVIATAKGLMQALFPSVAGYSTPFHRLLRKPWVPFLVGAVFMLVVAFVVLAFTWPRERFGVSASIITSFVIFIGTMWAWSGAQQETAPRAFTNAEDAIGELLKALGWALLTQPRTGQAEIDPFLAEIDFLATRQDRALLVLVTSPGLTEQEVVRKAANVALASSALTAADEKSQANSKPVEPVLVVLESEVSSKLHVFSNHQGVTVVHVPSVAELQPVGANSPSTTKEIAERIFGEALTEKLTLVPDLPLEESQFSLSPQYRMR